MCGALRDLVAFAQFNKREKHSWMSVNFSKVTGWKPATLLKLTLLHRCFSRFLSCANGTKLRNASDMIYIVVSFYPSLNRTGENYGRR